MVARERDLKNGILFKEQDARRYSRARVFATGLFSSFLFFSQRVSHVVLVLIMCKKKRKKRKEKKKKKKETPVGVRPRLCAI